MRARKGARSQPHLMHDRFFFAASQQASELLDKATSKHPFHSYTTPKWPHYASSNTAAVGFSPVQGLPVDNVLGVAVVHALEHLFEK